jgi:hypothetical protein
MESRISYCARLGRRLELSIANIVMFVGAVAVVSGMGAVSTVRASSVETDPPTFDVVSLQRVSVSDSDWGGMQRFPGLVRTPRNSLKELIGIAYDIEPEQIAGAPAWAESDRYDIQLSAPESSFVGPLHGTRTLRECCAKS